ncbi:hypothetical protein Droror1_Dr00027961, partial [Drosera rotundifolia]
MPSRTSPAPPQPCHRPSLSFPWLRRSFPQSRCHLLCGPVKPPPSFSISSDIAKRGGGNAWRLALWFENGKGDLVRG